MTNGVPEKVAFSDSICKLPVRPVEDGDAVVMDEVQKPAELMAKLSYEHLRHADHRVERRIDKLKYLLQHLVVARQHVLQFHLPTEATFR